MTDPLLRMMPPKVRPNNRVGSLRRTVSFVRWMLDNETATAAEIREQFRIHKSTAYRWLDAWKASVNGAA